MGRFIVDKNIVELLLDYDISELEIGDMLNMAPMLDIVSFEEFRDNCLLLVEFGYPKSDLDFLFLANPNIFVRSTQDLKKDLKKLCADCDDIELALKQDPNVI